MGLDIFDNQGLDIFEDIRRVSTIYADDVLLKLGTDSDQALLNRSTTLAANTALTGVFVGTPVTPALAANSLIVSGVTTDGDVIIAASDGGNSKAALFFDASTPDLYLYNVGGTWTAGATLWTIPAVTCSGAITANSDINILGHLCFQATAKTIRAFDADSASLLLYARDTGVGNEEVARLQGAADPYLQIGRDSTSVSISAVTDMLVLQAGAGVNNEAANFGLGISFKVGNAASEVEERASIDLVLTDATDASEDVDLNFNLMVAGAAPIRILSIKGSGLDFASGKYLYMEGGQVVGARVIDARCDDVVDATWDAVDAGVLDALRDAMISHGLIAAA